MREFQQKYMLRRMLYSRVTIVILFVLTILLLRSIMELNDKRLAVKKLVTESEAKRAELEEKARRAEEKSSFISTDRGLEAYIRTTYPVVREGEGVIVIYDEEGSPVAPVRTDMTVWERIKIFLRDAFAKS